MPVRSTFSGDFRSVLCPVDFSTHSAAALRYAAAIARRSRARLTVLTVNDPLLVSAADAAYGTGTLVKQRRSELQRFALNALKADNFGMRLVGFATSTGKPANEIVKVAKDHRCDLIVMGTQGMSGAAKLFFGSTTEGVLRRSTIPVLAVPPPPARRPSSR